MSDLKKRLETLSPQQRQLLLQKLQKKHKPSKETKTLRYPPIKPVSRQEQLPLSIAQQRIWFLEQLREGSIAYNMPACLRLTGRLAVASLEKALLEIIRRHESLRTSFKVINGLPTQVIEAYPKRKILPIIDLQSLPQEEQEKKISQLATEEANTPFDLSQGPLLRTTLLKVREDYHVLLLNLHHIISDGWSLANFSQELSILYDAFSQGKSSPLPELPVQYADFACWQRNWLKDAVLEKQLNYWKQQLAGLPPLLALPTDRPRPPVQTFRGFLKHYQLNESLTQEIELLTQKLGVTPYMILLMTLAILLSRYSGQRDLAIGSPIANRRQVETEAMIGFCLNTLVMRVRLEGNASVAELLNQVQQTALNAYAHQDVPFEHLADALQLDKNPSYSPWFQVLFVFQNMPKYNVRLSGLTVECEEIENQTAKFDLSLYVEKNQSQFITTWEYNTDLFEEARIERLHGHFQTLLEQIVSNQQQPINQLSLLTIKERHQLLVEWNNTETEREEETCIHQLFEKQVEKTPNAIAVEFKETALTYQELNNSANQLARYLKTLGIGPETLVGICVERSIEMLIGLLGILKAGGAYVPLDPGYPQERLSYILSDTKVPVLLTKKKLTDNLPDYQGRLVYLDEDWEVIAQESTATLNCESQADNLAYIIYTSGSTGNPKGVMIEHRALVNFTQGAIEEYGFTDSDRILQFASISFDTAAEEIYPCLSCGATLVLRTDEILASLPMFIETSRQWRLTVLDFPTAYWHQLMAEFPTANVVFPEMLRLVIVGGEQMLWNSLKIWQEYVGDRVKLMNGYGPTETTIAVTIYKFSTEDMVADLAESKVPIGRPIRNVKIYVLDEHKQPVPIGIPGELYIGGQCLARGYLNQPQVTEEAFIFSQELGTRLYKTGDLVRYLEDGSIEYLGRVDNQVKIRGFRVELGEIESALCTHLDVQEATVLVQENALGNKLLIAYIVSTLRPERVPYNTECLLEWEEQSLSLYTKDFSCTGIALTGVRGTWEKNTQVNLLLQLPGEKGQRSLRGRIIWHEGKSVGISFELTSAEQETVKTSFKYLLESEGVIHSLQRTLTKLLRDYLSVKLPNYMIPSSFVTVDEIPLTPNKKVDRRALLAMDISHHKGEESLLAPRDSLELELMQIWQNVLGVSNISIQDNFFELGGNSLLAIRLMAHIEDIGQHFPLATLLQNPTIENLAEILRQQDHYSFSSLVPIQKNGSQPPLFCIHPGGGNVLSYFDLSQELGADQPFYGLQSLGLNGEVDPLTSVEAMASHYIEAIQSVKPQGPYRLAGWSFGGLVAYEISQQLQGKGELVEFLGLFDTYEPSVAPPDPKDDASLLVSMFAQWLVLSEDYLRQLSFDEQLQYIVNEGKKANLVPPDYGIKQARSLIQVCKCNQQAEHQYQPQPYAGSISLLVASEEPLATPHDPTMGWSKLVAGGVEIYLVPGTHQTMVQKPHVTVMAKTLQSLLVQCGGNNLPVKKSTKSY